MIPGFAPAGWRELPFREFQEWVVIAQRRRREHALRSAREKLKGGLAG